MLNELICLERELHDPSVRKNAERLSELLHDLFYEVGRSGDAYDKTQILSSLEAETTHVVWSQDFELQVINDDLVLLTYRSAHIGEEKMLARFSRRSSLWQKVGGSWKLRFHQGTSTNAFKQSAS